jgi:tetratricopeptide (TPR) repeat protein
LRRVRQLARKALAETTPVQRCYSAVRRADLAARRRHNGAMSRLALVMIVRDEARCIARCLESARPWVDEMLVLDTGSSDDTPRLAAQLGAQVHHAAWTDDFAAARNMALALTDADWRLVLDGDEWLASGMQALHSLRSQEARFVGLVRVASLIDGPSGSETPSWLPRLLPRRVRYAGRIHEQPEPGLPRHRLDLVIGHDGYLTAQRGAKGDRNERLLRRALADQPGDAYLHYQLAKDLELRGRFDAAAPHYAQAAAGVEARAAWHHDLVLRRLFTLKNVGAFEQAVELAEAQMAQWSHSPDFFFAVGDLLLAWAAHEPERAGELLPMIESSWLRALEIGEQPALNDAVRGRGSFLAAHNLAVFHASLGHADQAKVWSARAQQLREEAAALAPALVS